VNGARLLGLDLAWSDRNPSGVAALAPDGTLLDVRADLRGDDEILAWVRRWRGTRGVIGIDMPTIVHNATGARAAERDLAAAFRHAHAGPHPANRSRPVFADGGRASRLIATLASEGVVEALDVAPDDARTIALEVFPHPAHVRLFGLDRVFRYKKKSRPWPDVLAEWARYRAALASLAGADPPLRLDERIPERVTAERYKRWDDSLDAITCAYVAAYVHRHGIARCSVYGDLAGGYIVVPGQAVFEQEASGVTRTI
jgi:predicted RNase H-like nuclease